MSAIPSFPRRKDSIYNSISNQHHEHNQLILNVIIRCHKIKSHNNHQFQCFTPHNFQLILRFFDFQKTQNI